MKSSEQSVPLHDDVAIPASRKMCPALHKKRKPLSGMKDAERINREKERERREERRGEERRGAEAY